MSVVLFLSLVACVAGPREGTAVGNPTNMAMDLAPASDAKIAAASVEVDLTRGWSCEGDAQEVTVERGVDLGAGEVPVPGGPLCALDVLFGGPLRLDLLGADEQVAVSLPVDAVRLRAVAPASADDGWVLRLGGAGWVSFADARAIALGDRAAEEAVIGRLVAGTSLRLTADEAEHEEGDDGAIMTTDDPPEAASDAEDASDAGRGPGVPGAAGRANGIDRGNGNGNGNRNGG